MSACILHIRCKPVIKENRSFCKHIMINIYVKSSANVLGLMQTRFPQIQEHPRNLHSACWKTPHKLILNWKFQLLQYQRPLEALEKGSKITTPVWMDFKNSFAWLTGMKKLIFGYNNFFRSSYFSIHEILKMDQKMTGAKKGIGSENQCFHSSWPHNF